MVIVITATKGEKTELLTEQEISELMHHDTNRTQLEKGVSQVVQTEESFSWEHEDVVYGVSIKPTKKGGK